MKKKDDKIVIAEETDAIDSYFDCVTACSITDAGVECITQCVSTHLKGEETHD